MDYFPSFLSSTIFFSIISFLVGFFIALRTYQITKQKKDFEQKNQLRNLLKEFLLFEGNYRSKVAKLSLSLAKVTSIEEMKYIDHTPSLLNIITENNLRGHPNKKINLLVSKIYKVHRKNILLRNLYIFSLKDSIETYPKALCNYEKTIIYKTILYVSIKDENFYKEVCQFYQKLMNENDCENQFRLGIALIEEEIKAGMFEVAETHFGEISDCRLTKNLQMAKSNIKYSIKRLEILLKKTVGIQQEKEEGKNEKSEDYN